MKHKQASPLHTLKFDMKDRLLVICFQGRGQAHSEVEVEVLLGNSQDANRSLRLAQVVVDADEGLHRRLGAALVLQLLVVQRLGECVALLCQGAQRPAQESR